MLILINVFLITYIHFFIKFYTKQQPKHVWQLRINNETISIPKRICPKGNLTTSIRSMVMRHRNNMLVSEDNVDKTPARVHQALFLQWSSFQIYLVQFNKIIVKSQIWVAVFTFFLNIKLFKINGNKYYITNKNITLKNTLEI